MIAARWIRLGLVEPLELHATCGGLAAAQPAAAAPLLLWAQAKAQLCLGPGSGLSETGPGAPFPVTRRSPGAELVWVDEFQYVFVLIAPRRLAPGRTARWCSWALSPAVATYRAFGLPAYLSGQDLWLHGRRIAGSGAARVGECAVIASSFMLRFPIERLGASPSPRFRAWLREGLALANTEWAEHGALPAERDLEAAFRGRLESQLGWRFENSWPTDAEAAAIVEARADLGDAIESERLRVSPDACGQLAG
jgi:hypothetical protein